MKGSTFETISEGDTIIPNSSLGIVKRTAAAYRGLQQSFYRYSFRMGTDSSCASSSSERMVLEIKKPLGVRYHRPSSLMPV